jgi:hypothetical protein
MILTPVAIDAHGRIGPMLCQNLYGTPSPSTIPPKKQFEPNRPNAKAYTNGQPPFQPPSAFSSKQINDGNKSKLNINNINQNSTDSAI